MGAADFIHKQLINAGGKDAVSNMLTGAAMGAGANTALGAVQGDFNIIGNAASGALLGAGGGAALRHAGDKYTNALAKMGKDAPSEFKFSTFSNAEKDTLDFWGSSDNLKRAQSFTNSTSGANANTPKAGTVSSKDGSVNRPGAEGHRDMPTAPTSVEVPTMPQYNSMGVPISGFGSARVAVDENTESVGEAIGRAGNRKGGGFTPMNAEQARAAQAAKDLKDAQSAQREDLKATFNRNKVKEQSIDRRQQRVLDKQIDNDIRAVNGDVSQMNNMPYTPNEIAKGYQRSGKDANQWAQEAVAKQIQSTKDAQSVAGDIIAGVFKETGRGPIKKPTSFEGGTLGLNKKPTDSSEFKPSFRNGEYQHPQHKKVKKYQPE